MAFWKGGPVEGSEEDERTPEMESLSERPGALLAASVWGMSLPWTLAISIAVGLWVMVSPDVLGFGGPAGDLLHLGGAVVVVVGVVALAEPLRALRFLNVLLGLTVSVLPWVVDGATVAGRVSALGTGLLVLSLAIPRGPLREQYGSWDRWVR